MLVHPILFLDDDVVVVVVDISDNVKKLVVVGSGSTVINDPTHMVLETAPRKTPDNNKNDKNK